MVVVVTVTMPSPKHKHTSSTNRLLAVVQRDLQITLDMLIQCAIAKLERRTQYIARWGDGSVARNALHAKRMWNSAAAAEYADI